MNNNEIFNLALNIGLGVVTLILSIFTIWLSLKFNEYSTSALDSVKELNREIKTLVQIQLSQQSNFSNKMLDSIIEQNRFGQPHSNLTELSTEATITKSIENAEKNISDSVEKRVREIISLGKNDPRSFEEEINSIRTDIKGISGVLKEQSGVIEALRNFQDLPAHYILLAAIINSNSQSPKDVENIAQKYSVPRGWDNGGISNLLNAGLLQGTETNFTIPKEIKRILIGWLKVNSEVINSLAESYKNKQNDRNITEQERELAKMLRF